MALLFGRDMVLDTEFYIFYQKGGVDRGKTRGKGW